MNKVGNVLRTVRNNWKKSVFGVCGLAYAVDFGADKYAVSRMMREYCEDAVKFGNEPVGRNRLRRITVILNPAANHKKAKKMFEKYCAPLLYLSGVYVSIIETEKEGHARELVQDIDPLTDAIVIAGGDGTLSETITGLMRSRGELCKIPIGVLPLGQRNSLATSLFGTEESHHVSKMAKATMAVIKGNTKPIDAFRIEVLSEMADGDNLGLRPVYGVTSVEWGLRRELRRRADNLWWLGPLKQFAPLVFTGPFYHTQNNLGFIEAQIRYSPPCSGCNNCYKHRPDLSPNLEENGSVSNMTRKWWNIVSLKNRRLQQAKHENKILTDYSSIENEQCKTIEEKVVNTSDLCFTTETSAQNNASGDTPKILMKIGPKIKYQGQLFSDGLKLMNEESSAVIDKLEAKQIELRPKIETSSKSVIKGIGEGDCLSIDNEDYEVKPIKITVLPNSVKVFC